MDQRLTPVEHAAYRQQLEERRCLVCVHVQTVEAWGGSHVGGCALGKRWPQFGTCKHLHPEGVK